MRARRPALNSKGDAPGSSSSWRISYVAGRPSSGTTISINSGELDLKIRRKWSFAVSAGADEGAETPATLFAEGIGDAHVIAGVRAKTNARPKIITVNR